MNPILSICIASYNKAEFTYNLVKSILSNSDLRLGVVVVDNASTDDTVERLYSIMDDRFRIVVNDYNTGGAANMVHAVYSCSSGYCLYCNDRDLIYPDKLSRLIDFLEKHLGYSCGWVVRNTLEDQPIYYEFDTPEAFKKLCYRCEHPTGFLFNSEILKEFPEEYFNAYIYPSDWTAFPFENIQAELISKGKFVQYNETVWHSTGSETSNKYVSEFEKLDTDGDRWFYAPNCINRGKAYLEQFWKLIKKYSFEFDERTRYEIYANIILAEEKIGVWRYKTIFESHVQCYHYKVAPKRISYKELRNNRKQILDELLKLIRNYEGEGSYETIIFELIDKEDSDMRKRLLIRKIAGNRIVRWLRGKK